MPRRTALLVPIACLSSLLVTTALARPGVAPKTAKIGIPAAGKFTVIPIAVTTTGRTKPKLKVSGAVATGVIVYGGLTADSKTKGRYIGAVIVATKKPTIKGRRITGATRPAATIVVVAGSGNDVVVMPSLRSALCLVHTGDLTVASSTFLANGPGGSATKFGDAGLSVFCDHRFGAFTPDAGQQFFDDLIAPAPALSCTFTAERDPHSPSNEVDLHLACTQTVSSVTFTFPAGNTILDGLPSTSVANGSSITFTGNFRSFPGIASSNEFDVRFTGNMGGGLLINGSATSTLGTTTFSGKGPP